MNDPRRTGRVNVKVLVILIVVVGTAGGGAVIGHYVRKRTMADRALAAGTAAFEAKNWTEACKQFKQYLGKYPNDVTVLERYCEANMSVRPIDPDHVGAAIGAYRRLLRYKPGDAAISSKLAKLYYGVRDYADAAHLCSQRLAVDADDADALYWMGRALNAQAKNDEATETLTHLVEKHPDRVKGYALLGALALQVDTGHPKDVAFDWLNRGVKANPKSSEALAQRARFQRVVRGDRDAALADLDAAVALGFDDPVVQLFVADEWIEWGQFDKAAEGLKALDRVDAASLEGKDLDEQSLGFAVWSTRAKMALRDPQRADPAALADRTLAALDGNFRKRFLPVAVKLYLSAGHVPDAERYLQEYKDARAAATRGGPPSREEVLLDARVAGAAARSYEAINLLEGSGQSFEDDSSALRVLSDAFLATGQFGRGRAALRHYVERVPQDRRALLKLAQAYRNDQWDRVETYSRAALRLRPTLGARLLSLEARMMLASGKPNETAVLDEVGRNAGELKDQFPDNTGVRMLRAAVLLRKGAVDEAVAELKAAIAECDPKLPAESRLIQLYARRGRVDEAVAAAERMIHEHGDLASPRLALADLRRRSGHGDEAVKVLRDAAEQLTGEERYRVRRALAQQLILGGARGEALALLRTLADERSDDADIRVSLMALPEVRADKARAARRIDELKAIEGDAGVRWKLEQARLWLESDQWRARQAEVLELLQACLRADPGWEAPSLVLATVYERIGNLREAEQALRVALTNNSLALTAADRLIGLLKRQGRYVEAERVLDGLPVDTNAFRLQRVDLALGRGDYDEALRRLDLYVSSHPEDVPAMVRLARLVYAVRQDRSRADQLLAEALARSPDSLEVLRARVSLLHTSGESEAALTLLDSEVARLNNFGVYWMRAKYLSEIGRFEDAERDYRHLTSFADQAVAGYVLLRDFYGSRGRHADAVAALRAGLKLDAESPALNRSLMKTLLAGDSPDERARGRELLHKLEESAPDDPELLRIDAALLIGEHTTEAGADAEEKLERAVSLNPADLAAHLLLIHQARARGDVDRAASLTSRALATNPTAPALQIARIAVEVDAGRTRVARELARKLLDERGSDLGAVNQLTDVFRRAGDMKTAAVFSERALAIDPNDEYANTARAVALAATGDAEAAIAQLKRFTESDTGAKSVAALLALASIAVTQREFAVAEAALARADGLAPGDARVARERMAWLAAQARYDEVVEVLSKVRANHGDDAASLVAGGYALATSSDTRLLREARRAFEAAIRADAQNLAAYRGLANVAYRTEDVDATINAYRSLLKLSPDDAGALNDLAWILAHDKGDAGRAEAEQLATRGVTLYPQDVHLLDTRGVIHFQLGRYDDARRDLEKCRTLTKAESGTRAVVCLHLAQVLAAQGADANTVRALLDEAREIDEQASTLSDEDRAAMRTLLASP